MTRVHPQFLMNGFKKAVEKQDFGEFNKELTNGIAALEELASTYKKTVPGAGNIADTFRKNTKSIVFMTKVPKGN